MLELLHSDARESLRDEIDALETCRSRDARPVVRACLWVDRVDLVMRVSA